MMGGSMMGWAWIWLVLVLIGLALLAYVAFQLAQNRGASAAAASAKGSAEGLPGARSPARQILDERYARGEIDEADYHRRRDDLA